MSFQGDVGGIGLADLLQSLARGREGVLTLTTKSGLKSTLGVQSGLLHLLPEIDEDPEYWRNRARQAWVKDPDFRIDSLRMVEIARAQRIENIYSLLDSPGVHFRFVPGPLPARPVESAMSQGEPGTARKGHRRDAVYCQGMSVEGLLLEYARLSDEIQSAGPTIVQSDHAVLCIFEPGYATEGSERLLAECDGYSNLIEIADRLSWPMRQMRLNANVQLTRGVLRLAEPHELLALGAQELAQSNFARAASRLSAWCETGMPGPLPPPDAEFLEIEWQSGRLASAVHAMPARHGRTLLRRIDLALVNPVSAAEHWLELVKAHKDDELSALHAMMCQVRTGIDPNVPSISDLMAVARRFSERSQFLRARAVLRVAAARLPDATSVRLDVAMHMLAAGIKRESVGILVECARSLIDEGKFENAVPPLRAVIEAEPGHREARRLLSRARTKVMQRTIVRKNSLVTIAVVLAISVGAVVQYRSHREYDRKISQITLAANEPRRALKILEQLFPDEKSGSVAELRDSLLERMRFEENAIRTAWTDRYREAQLECTLGDPVLGLQRALDLPDPPTHDESAEPWPLVSDLYNGLAARLDALLTEMGNAVDEKSEQQHDEQRLHNLIADLQSALQQWETDAKERKQSPPTEARDFTKRLVELQKNLTARSEQRAQARADGLRQANLARQDLLLAAARAHAEAGDHARAMSAYERLIETDETHKLKDLLAKEMQTVEKKSGALAEARGLALKGDHARAREVLGQSVENFRDYLLPWRLKSFPSGARATLADGSVRVTPVVFETAFDEHVDIVLELDGYEPTKLAIDQPADRMIVLSRLPERWWQTHSRVEALPVATGEDHVLADRSGWIVRMSKDSHVVWQAKLSSLAGVARSPVFLPKKPGHLLLVSEDGAAWIVNAANGSMDGPLELGSPPREGPVATDSGARVRLRDGRVAEWEARLKPEMLDDFGPDTPLSAGAKDDSLSTGSTAGLAVMRRGTNASTKLASPWTGDSIEISDEYYSVRNGASTEPAFTVRRTGDWTFVAFEAPHSLIPRGRLWIADGRGLLSYVP